MKNMKKYFRIWENKYITCNAQNIDDYIEIYESLTKLLKKWKEEGVYLDLDSNIEDDQAIFITTDLQIANEGGFKQDISDELETNLKHYINEKMDAAYIDEEIRNDLKISILSKNEKIIWQFLKAIKATNVFDSIKNSKIGIEFAKLVYQKKEKVGFQFWLMSNELRFRFLIPTYMKGSRGIIYFYNINDKIDENRLNLIFEQLLASIPVLFVGYDSILPENPENTDQNIQIIKKIFNESKSMYVSAGHNNSMLLILDKIFDLATYE